MARWWISLLVAAIGVVAGLVAAWIQPAKPKEEAPSTRITELLEGIVVPRVEVSGLNIEQAVETLNRYAAVREPFHADPPFVLWKRGDPIPQGLYAPSAPPRAPVQIPGLEGISGAQEAGSEDNEITAVMTDIPLTEVARFFTGIANHSFAERGGHIVVYPKDALNTGLVTREFYLLSTYTAESLFHIPAGGSGRIDVRNALETNGVHFAPGASAYYESRDMRLVVSIEADQICPLDAIFGLGGCDGLAAVPSRWERFKVRTSNYWYEISSHFPWNSHP